MFSFLLLVAVVVLVVMLIRARRKADAAMQHAAAAQQQHAAALQHAAAVESWSHGQAAQHAAALDQRAARAVAASRGSFDGHIAQQAFPVTPQHNYHPKDIFHMGGVMDYVVFDGLHEVRHNGGDPRSITVVFADVKWGSSRLSDVQRAVMTAVNEGRVRAEEWRAQESDAGSLSYTRRELR